MDKCRGKQESNDQDRKTLAESSKEKLKEEKKKKSSS